MDAKEFEGLTPEAAKEKIADIMVDPKSPYFDKNDLRHKDAVSRMGRLHSIAYGSEEEPEDAGIVDALKEAGLETAEDVDEAALEDLTKETKERLEKVEIKLKEEFGDKFEEVTALADEGLKFALEEYPDLADALETPQPDGSIPGNDPKVVRTFEMLGRLIRKAKGGA